MSPLLAQDTSARATTNIAGALVFTNQFGNLNDDGRVSIHDVVLLTHQIRGTLPLAPELAARGDLDQDGQNTVADRKILVNMILELAAKADDDFDSDDLPNAEEVRLNLNPFQADLDHDGWVDGVEVADGTDPRDAASHPGWLIVAQPSVEVSMPSLETMGIGGTPMYLAQPPVQVDIPSPETMGIGGVPLFLAQPPVQVNIPSPETMGIGGWPIYLAEPPVSISIPSN